MSPTEALPLRQRRPDYFFPGVRGRHSTSVLHYAGHLHIQALFSEAEDEVCNDVDGGHEWMSAQVVSCCHPPPVFELANMFLMGCGFLYRRQL